MTDSVLDGHEGGRKMLGRDDGENGLIIHSSFEFEWRKDSIEKCRADG
jgi:hypothetical protein